MGYDLHITRREDWSEKGNDISFEEWQAYVAGDPEMRIDGFAETQTASGEIVRIEAPGLTIWTRPSGDGHPRWFHHQRGRIDVKNPDAELFPKMWSIAQYFGARVQGDEGECYDADGNIVR